MAEEREEIAELRVSYCLHQDKAEGDPWVADFLREDPPSSKVAFPLTNGAVSFIGTAGAFDSSVGMSGF